MALQQFTWVACSPTITLSEGGRVASGSGLVISSAVFEAGAIAGAAARIEIASGLTSSYDTLRVGFVPASALPALPPAGAGSGSVGGGAATIVVDKEAKELGNWKGSYGLSNCGAHLNKGQTVTFRHPSVFREAATGKTVESNIGKNAKGLGVTELGMLCDWRAGSAAARCTYSTGLDGTFTDTFKFEGWAPKITQAPVRFALMCVARAAARGRAAPTHTHTLAALLRRPHTFALTRAP